MYTNKNLSHTYIYIKQAIKINEQHIYLYLYYSKGMYQLL